MSSFYYLGIGVVSLAMTIYNFEKASQTGDYTLLKNVTKTNTTNETDANGELKNNTYTELDEISNAIVPLLYIIAIVFLLFLVLSLYMSCIINSFSNLLPEDFLTMSKCKAAVTCLCKIIPPIFLILSWLNLILIVVVWILYLVYFCGEENENDYPKYQIEQAEKSVSDDVLILNIVNSVVWFVTHYGGSIIREMTYIEPFMYSPDTGETPNCFRTLMIKKLGP